MITTIIATTLLAPPQTSDSLKTFLPDYIANALPYVQVNVDRRFEFAHISELGPDTSEVMTFYDTPNTKWSAIAHRSNLMPLDENQLIRTSFSMSLHTPYQPDYRVANALRKQELKRMQNGQEVKLSELYGLKQPLNIGDIAYIHVRSGIPQTSTKINNHEEERDAFIVWIDLNHSFLQVGGEGKFFVHQIQQDINFMTTISRRATAFALGLGTHQDFSTTLSGLDVPGKKFGVYPNRMVNWNFYAKEKDISWQYSPNSASIQINGKAPIQLLLGTRTYKIGQDEWVADAPVTIHDQEFYVEENAMATILNAL